MKVCLSVADSAESLTISKLKWSGFMDACSISLLPGTCSQYQEEQQNQQSSTSISENVCFANRLQFSFNLSSRGIYVPVSLYFFQVKGVMALELTVT